MQLLDFSIQTTCLPSPFKSTFYEAVYFYRHKLEQSLKSQRKMESYRCFSRTFFSFLFHPCSPLYQIQSSPFVRKGRGPILTTSNLVPRVSLFSFPWSVGTRFVLRLSITSLNNPAYPKNVKHLFSPSYILTL